MSNDFLLGFFGIVFMFLMIIGLLFDISILYTADILKLLEYFLYNLVFILDIFICVTLILAFIIYKEESESNKEYI